MTREHYFPIESAAGITSGRDAVCLDNIGFDDAANRVEFPGELNASLRTALGRRGEFVPYRLVFAGVPVFRMIELGFADFETRSSEKPPHADSLPRKAGGARTCGVAPRPVLSF